MIEFLMPSLGADMEAGTLVEWRKQQGDEVRHGDIIADVETQKGLIEIEVFDEGIIDQLLIEEGAKVPVGSVMALIKPFSDAIKPETAMETETKKVEAQPIEEKALTSSIRKPMKERRVKVTPLAKRIAADNNIDLSHIKGTGPEGAIVKADVEKAMAEKVTHEEIKGEEEIRESIPDVLKPKGPPPMEAIRAAVAAAMSKSNREIPHYYLEKTVDMTKALSWLMNENRQREVQKRLLPAALLIKAVAEALDEVPQLNGIWDNGLQIKNEINIGFVISLRAGGIIVPTLHQADTKSVGEIMDMLNDVIPRARAYKLRSSELSDSTVTITNIGEGSANKVFGVIYPPQVAIVGFGNISEQPFAENGMLGIRPQLSVTLAGDHRATDGLIGSRFLGALNKHLQNPDAL